MWRLYYLLHTLVPISRDVSLKRLQIQQKIKNASLKKKNQ